MKWLQFFRDLGDLSVRRTLHHLEQDVTDIMQRKMRMLSRYVLRQVVSFSFIALGLVFLCLSVMYFLVEYLAFSKTLVLFSMGLVIFLIGFILKLID